MYHLYSHIHNEDDFGTRKGFYELKHSTYIPIF